MMKMSDKDLDIERICDLTWLEVLEYYEGTYKPKRREKRSCRSKAEYRVTIFSDKKYLIDGGDASNLADYRSEKVGEYEYLCGLHFDQLYKHHPFYARIYGRVDEEKRTPLELPKFTFKKMKPQFKKKEKKEVD